MSKLSFTNCFVGSVVAVLYLWLYCMYIVALCAIESGAVITFCIDNEKFGGVDDDSC